LGIETIEKLLGDYGISDASHASLAALVKPQSLAKRTQLSEPGKVWDELLFLEKGALRSYALGEAGEEKTYFLFFEGNWVCDLRSFAERNPSRFFLEILE